MSLVGEWGGASPLGLRPPIRGRSHVLLRSLLLGRSRSPRGWSLEEPQGPGGSPLDSDESSAKQEVILEGQDISNRRPLPFPVGLTGIHAGAEPPGNVVARFFPERLMMILDLDTQQPIEPLAS